MKHFGVVNETIAKIVDHVIAQPEGFSLKIDNRPGVFMPFVVSYIAALPKRLSALIYFEHYYIQEGDRMYDPLMEVEYNPTVREFYPIAYEQSNLGIYRRSRDIEKGTYNPAVYRDQKAFLAGWLRNVVEQQGLQGWRPDRGMPRLGQRAGEFKIGDLVSVKGADLGGQIINMKGDDVLVQYTRQSKQIPEWYRKSEVERYG